MSVRESITSFKKQRNRVTLLDTSNILDESAS